MRDLKSFGQVCDSDLVELQNKTVIFINKFLDSKNYYSNENLSRAIKNTLKRELQKERNRLLNFDFDKDKKMTNKITDEVMAQGDEIEQTSKATQEVFMEMEEMERLAPIMAEFIGWEKVINNLGSPIWNAPETIQSKLFPDDTFANIHQIKTHFFDPDSEKPNPRGFQPVLDRLDEKFENISISVSKNHSVVWMGKNRSDIRIPYIGDGPNRYIALYRAVEQLMNEVTDKGEE